MFCFDITLTNKKDRSLKKEISLEMNAWDWKFAYAKMHDYLEKNYSDWYLTGCYSYTCLARTIYS